MSKQNPQAEWIWLLDGILAPHAAVSASEQQLLRLEVQVNYAAQTWPLEFVYRLGEQCGRRGGRAAS